ncbi:MAG: hypothetical protein ACPHRO_10385 [Nannocystaceae bacterium]
MQGIKTRVVVGAAIIGLGAVTWSVGRSSDAFQMNDDETGNVARSKASSRTSASSKESADDLAAAARLNKRKSPKKSMQRPPDREGLEALTGVLGGGFGFDGETAERDEEAFPRPESIEEARTMFTDALAAVETELMADGEISEDKKRELRHRSNLALSDLQDHLDLETPEGKTELNDARRSTRTAMMDLGPLNLERRPSSGGTEAGAIPSPQR